jgi:NTP pyrophosphatase (non-canonical NTP hydrolase)
MSEISRDQLGELVRLAWIEWALEQPEPKPSWLVPYQDLPETDKEADRRIGEFVADVLAKQYHPLDLYQEEVRRTTGTKDHIETVVMTAMGLAGEVGECVDVLKKYIFHDHSLDKGKLALELGDVLWYLTALCNALEIPLKEVIDKNVEKLRKRYPDGFSSEKSRNREEETNGK